VILARYGYQLLLCSVQFTNGVNAEHFSVCMAFVMKERKAAILRRTAERDARLETLRPSRRTMTTSVFGGTLLVGSYHRYVHERGLLMVLKPKLQLFMEALRDSTCGLRKGEVFLSES